MDDKIVISVINNTGLWPSYFCMDLVNLYITTLQKYPNTELRTVEANSVENMRNYACRYAMGLKKLQPNDKLERKDYLVMLDSDHRYAPDFILKLMKHKKDIVTGCTSNRTAPFIQTQFKVNKKNIKEKDNQVNPKPEEPLMKIGASGPVGMLIKVDVLFRLEFPYYKREYIGTEKEGNVEAEKGSDIWFCGLLNKIDVDIWLDPSITFPHEVRRVFVNRGQLKL